MLTITVTSSEFDPSGDLQDIPPLGVDFHVPTVDTKVEVRGGIAAAPPTCLDYDVDQSIECSSTAWHNLHIAVREASEILGRLDECNWPTLDDRFHLNVYLRRIREGADQLERHIAKSGLWLSEDEWHDCDSRNTWHQF